MFKMRFEVNGKELEPREQDALMNRFLINAVCFAIAVTCWIGWLPAVFVWGVAAISFASLFLRKNTVFGILHRVGIWIIFLSGVYENSLSSAWQNVALIVAFATIWADTLWAFIQNKRHPERKE